MKKALMVTACLGCFIATTVIAQPAQYRMPARGYGMPQQAPAVRAPQQQVPAEIKEAGKILKAGLNKLLGFFKAKQAPTRAQIAEFLDKEISPYFDFAYMAKWAAGSAYPRMSDQQKDAVEAELRTQFLTTMAQKLTSFDSQTVRYLKPKITSPKQVELSIAIGNPRGYPARLDFRMYKSAQGWKVYDVSANGSSALMYYRQYFKQKLQPRRMAPSRYMR